MKLLKSNILLVDAEDIIREELEDFWCCKKFILEDDNEERILIFRNYIHVIELDIKIHKGEYKVYDEGDNKYFLSEEVYLLIDCNGNKKLDSLLMESLNMYTNQIDKLTCDIVEH